MKQFISVDVDLNTVVHRILADGDSDTLIELINVAAAHILDTHGKQHKEKKKRFEIFVGRASHELNEDGTMLAGVLFEDLGT